MKVGLPFACALWLVTTVAGQQQTYTPAQYQSLLGVGMDVDWLKTGSGRTQNWKSREQRGVDVPQVFKDRGFSHVRLRVKEYDLEVINPKTGVSLLEEMKRTVDDCLDSALIPVLAFQGARFKSDPTNPDEMDAVVDWWVAVATALQDRDYLLSYNIIIETTEEIKKHNDKLNELYQRVETAVHAIDATRILIIAPNKISSPLELDKLEVPDNDYMMVQWHFYAAGPKRDNPKKQWTTGTELEKSLITDKVDVALSWSADNGIPTWVGAWMPSNFNDGGTSSPTCPPGGGSYSIEEQVVFATFMSQTLQCSNIPYAVNSDTKYYNRNTNEWCAAMAPVVDAIVAQYSCP
ncbi:Cellulase (glycosyl hydrolase 5) [Gracilaria domingensis]|nr:Cellulase (glycosyl hydrolase 5) [Gracilaria domingensis]